MANEFLHPGPVMGAAATPRAAEKFSWSDSYQKYSYLALVGFTALLVYSFWNMLEDTSQFWKRAQYSHGYILPLIALYLMWSRRPNPYAQEPREGESEETFLGFAPASRAWQGFVVASVAAVGAGLYFGSDLLQGVGVATLCIATMGYVLVGQPFAAVPQSDRWIGLGVIVVAYAGRMVAAQWDILPLDRLCFLIALGGLFFMVGGTRLMTWAGPAVGFLVFMFPIPSRIEGPLLGKLQTLASIGSEVVLTILGVPMTRQGNKILLDNVKDLTVAEECSGLRMLTIFGAMAIAMVFLIRRPWWDKFIILVSAIPIALVSNVIRIVVTAILYRVFPENELIDQLIHDWAGFAMMPIALGLLYLEMKVLSMLSTPEEGMEVHAAGVG